MKPFTILVSTLLAVCVLLSSCQTPQKSPYDRPPAKWKAATMGGLSPTHSKHRH